MKIAPGHNCSSITACCVDDYHIKVLPL